MYFYQETEFVSIIEEKATDYLVPFYAFTVSPMIKDIKKVEIRISK